MAGDVRSMGVSTSVPAGILLRGLAMLLQNLRVLQLRLAWLNTLQLHGELPVVAEVVDERYPVTDLKRQRADRHLGTNDLLVIDLGRAHMNLAPEWVRVGKFVEVIVVEVHRVEDH